MPKKPSTKLALVPSQPADDGVRPPPHLRELGLTLWRDVTESYLFDDPASYTILGLACGALDRAEALRAQIDADGEMIRGKFGVKSNPLLRDELQNRALCARLLGQLGLDLEPIRSGPQSRRGHHRTAPSR